MGERFTLDDGEGRIERFPGDAVAILPATGASLSREEVERAIDLIVENNLWSFDEAVLDKLRAELDAGSSE